MKTMIRVYYWDKMGKRGVYEVEKNVSVFEFLKKNNIPSHAVLVISSEGKPLKVEDKINTDSLCINMYNYDISTFLEHTKNPTVILKGIKDEIVISKKFFKFDESGNVEPLIIKMDKHNFTKYYEERIRKTLSERCEVNSGDKIAVGFSGGVDSSSFLIALKNSRLLKKLDLMAITVTGVPDAETLKGVEHTRYLTSKIGIKHVITNPEDIRNIYNLRKPFIEIVKELIKDSAMSSKMIFIGHAVIRRILEEYSKINDIKKIAFCIEAEGMVANILSSLFSGYPITGIFKKHVGDFEYIYPLSFLTKSENLLYLFLNDNTLLSQEPSGEVHTRAPDLRTINFILFENMNDVIWGIYEYLIEGFDKLLKDFFQISAIKTRKCSNCKDIFLEFKDSEEKSDICPVCKIFYTYNYIF